MPVSLTVCFLLLEIQDQWNKFVAEIERMKMTTAAAAATAVEIQMNVRQSADAKEREQWNRQAVCRGRLVGRASAVKAFTATNWDGSSGGGGSSDGGGEDATRMRREAVKNRP